MADNYTHISLDNLKRFLTDLKNSLLLEMQNKLDDMQKKLTEMQTKISDLGSSSSNEIAKKMDKDNPTGTGSLSINRLTSSTIGENSVAIGNDNTASGDYSVALGSGTKASSARDFAVGDNTTASGGQSFAEGSNTVASGLVSHASGQNTSASHGCQFVVGEVNKDYADTLFEVGNGDIATKLKNNAFEVRRDGYIGTNQDDLRTNFSIEGEKDSSSSGKYRYTLNVKEGANTSPLAVDLNAVAETPSKLKSLSSHFPQNAIRISAIVVATANMIQLELPVTPHNNVLFILGITSGTSTINAYNNVSVARVDSEGNLTWDGATSIPTIFYCSTVTGSGGKYLVNIYGVTNTYISSKAGSAFSPNNRTDLTDTTFSANNGFYWLYPIEVLG